MFYGGFGISKKSSRALIVFEDRFLQMRSQQLLCDALVLPDTEELNI